MEKPVDDVTEVEEENEELVETEETQEEAESSVPEEETEEMELEEDEEDLDMDMDAEEEGEEPFVEAKERASRKEHAIEEEDIVEERFYTIPLRKVWTAPRKKRAPKAARVVRSFVMKHMKVQLEAFDEEEEPEKLVIDNEVNEKLWSRGIEKPPRKIRVRVVKDKEGVVTVLLAEGD
jgi:large subunit ribosomal protein L31e